MTYVPTYLTFSPRDRFGWPDFVTDEARDYCVRMVREALQGGPVTLGQVEEALFGRAYSTPAGLPACLRKVATWDARYAVAHRAALEAGGEQVWRARS